MIKGPRIPYPGEQRIQNNKMRGYLLSNTKNQEPAAKTRAPLPTPDGHVDVSKAGIIRRQRMLALFQKAVDEARGGL